ncbi:glycosyltransferase family 4 protein [Desulfovibrio sp. OttesenSCG-928-G11]|nr:glycosyltransferase family 4 protein [Desulfovibrio sp. OttesenSCG-928-G11]
MNRPLCVSRKTRIWASLDAFVEGGPILGRRVANSAFLRALLKADPYDAYHFFLPDQSAVSDLRAWLEQTFPDLERRGAFVVALRATLPKSLARTDFHCFHLSDPVTHGASLAALRNAVSRTIFPVTSLTHSLSYVRFMGDFLKLLWPGVCARDALIVTSQSARLVMQNIFAALRRSYGLEEAFFPAPELVPLPLGVDDEALPGANESHHAPGADSAPARDLRARLNIGARVMILSLARFSPADKMDCLPLLQALRRARDLGLDASRCVLVLAGWAEPGDALPEALAACARSLDLETRLVLRPSDKERRTLYAAADIFVSPADNIQETFGLSVAEAQAAGLPVAASDFDGYRDIVAHGESGLLIPTLAFADTALSEVRSLVWHDNQYLLGLAQQTAVSVPGLALALVRLGQDQDLRRSMGRAARQRAERLFTWKAVLPRWCALWDELAARPLERDRETALRLARHPQSMRFGEFFRGHFTAVLDEAGLAGMAVKRTALGEALYRGALPAHFYAGLDELLDDDLLRRALLAARKGIAARELLELLRELAIARGLAPALAGEMAAFTLLWALKQDCLETEDGGIIMASGAGAELP